MNLSCLTTLCTIRRMACSQLLLHKTWFWQSPSSPDDIASLEQRFGDGKLSLLKKILGGDNIHSSGRRAIAQKIFSISRGLYNPHTVQSNIFCQKSTCFLLFNYFFRIQSRSSFFPFSRSAPFVSVQPFKLRGLRNSQQKKGHNTYSWRQADYLFRQGGVLWYLLCTNKILGKVLFSCLITISTYCFAGIGFWLVSSYVFLFVSAFTPFDCFRCGVVFPRVRWRLSIFCVTTEEFWCLGGRPPPWCCRNYLCGPSSLITV